jgi:NitT/TauT family transport system substrate-binding protein
MRSLKIALPLIVAVLAAGAAQADPVKIRLSYVIAPSDWAPLLPEKPELLTHNGKSYQLEVVRVVGTPALVQAMANNEIEIGNHSYSSLASRSRTPRDLASSRPVQTACPASRPRSITC